MLKVNYKNTRKRREVVVLCKCPGSKSPGGYCLGGNFSRTIAGEQWSRELVDISMDISGG